MRFEAPANPSPAPFPKRRVFGQVFHPHDFRVFFFARRPFLAIVLTQAPIVRPRVAGLFRHRKPLARESPRLSVPLLTFTTLFPKRPHSMFLAPGQIFRQPDRFCETSAMTVLAAQKKKKTGPALLEDFRVPLTGCRPVPISRPKPPPRFKQIVI